MSPTAISLVFVLIPRVKHALVLQLDLIPLRNLISLMPSEGHLALNKLSLRQLFHSSTPRRFRSPENTKRLHYAAAQDSFP